MARPFHVQGPRTYLYTSIFLLGLGLWAIKDGWFPSEKVLKRHPMRDEQGQLDHFYIFNRSLAVLTLTGAAVCGVVHRIVR